MTGKQIHVCQGNYIYSTKYHCLLSLAIAYSVENKCKVFFPFTPFYETSVDVWLWDIKTVKDLPCPVMIWCFPRLSQQIWKFPRGPWPLNVTHRVSFSLYILYVHCFLCTELHTFCSSVAQLWRVQEVVCLHRRGNCSAACSSLDIVNDIVFILADTVMDNSFYWPTVWNNKNSIV